MAGAKSISSGQDLLQHMHNCYFYTYEISNYYEGTSISFFLRCFALHANCLFNSLVRTLQSEFVPPTEIFLGSTKQRPM